MKRHVSHFVVLVALSHLAGSACGSSPTTPGGTPPPTARVGATITIRSDGTVEPAEVRVAVGEKVRFINQDSRPHQPNSNPHLFHTDCPPTNTATPISPGQTVETGVFDRIAVCGFHDHINPDSGELQGVIRVGTAEGPPGPVYVKQ
jgi:plastocyanin